MTADDFWKTFWQQNKMRDFSICQNVFNSRLFQRRQRGSVWGKSLLYRYVMETCWVLNGFLMKVYIVIYFDVSIILLYEMINWWNIMMKILNCLTTCCLLIRTKWYLKVPNICKTHLNFVTKTTQWVYNMFAICVHCYNWLGQRHVHADFTEKTELNWIELKVSYALIRRSTIQPLKDGTNMKEWLPTFTQW